MSDLQHEYKVAKEAFVSQLEGGSIYQINIVSLTALTTFSLWASLRSANILQPVKHSSYSILGSSALLANLCIEFLILIVPIVLAVTILSNHLLVLNGAIAVLSLYVKQIRQPPRLIELYAKGNKKKRHWSKQVSDEDSEDEGFQNGHQHEMNSEWQGHVRTNSRPTSISVEQSVHIGNASGSASAPLYSSRPGAEINTARSSTDSRRKWKDRDSIPPSNEFTNATHASLSRSQADSDAQGASSPLLRIKLSTEERHDKYVPRNQAFLSVYRAHMMLMTIVCILAVDFPAFPRQYGKCETWGTSLMDLGVGSFVFSMGIVSALPFLRSPMQRFKPLKAQLYRDTRRSIPLFLLGSIRVIMVKGVDYPEHISEYGVHWNFFFTLALLPFFGTLCRPLARQSRYSIIGLLLSLIHQVALSFTNLGTWAISNSLPRTNLLYQNKEGIASLPGYLSIFLIGMDLGLYVLPKDPYLAYRKPSKSRKREKTDKLAMLLASLSILWWAAYYSHILILQGSVSRRLANLSYVLWITAYNTTFVFCYVIIYIFLLQHTNDQTPKNTSTSTSQKSLDDGRTPILLQSLNHSAFIVFLVANLLTGLVNVSFQTMYSSDTTAVIILLLYTATCLLLATLLHMKNWRLPI